MNDYYEIDFLPVGDDKSGDAITMRYSINGQTAIHVVDAGYQETGPSVVEHIKQYYGNPSDIHHVVVTHPDGDHAGGVQEVLKAFNVGTLWMLRPWTYANLLLVCFSRFKNANNLQARLQEIYPNLAALESLAAARKTRIQEPLQGMSIGPFKVLAPSWIRYMSLIEQSEKTPELEASRKKLLESIRQQMSGTTTQTRTYVNAKWGNEAFSPNETSPENDMSVIQWANLCGDRILLTGDAGRMGLSEAAAWGEQNNLGLPGLTYFQVPHHGSRRNISSEVLDRWLGKTYSSRLPHGAGTFYAIVSASKKDKAHPRKAVVRAAIHRGANVLTTQGNKLRISRNAPARNWVPAVPLGYPEEQEQ